MAAKSKKWLSKIENKLLKLNKLQLNDVLCSICQSILVEPVTLPCNHDFCQSCFNGSVQNNALCCPLCRLRIGSWLRTATKKNNLVNLQLWNFIQTKFEDEIVIKLKGEDLKLPNDTPILNLSKPGEIRKEYEAEIKRVKAEHIFLEQKHLEETEILVKKLQKEEEESQKIYLERLQQDEQLAMTIHKSNSKTASVVQRNKSTVGNKLKPMKIDKFLIKKATFVNIKDSPLMTDDNSSTGTSTPKVNSSCKCVTQASPELVPSYGNFIKNFLDKKIRNVTGLWNKENGITISKKETKEAKDIEHGVSTKEVDLEDTNKKQMIQSLPVSLPYKGLLRRKPSLQKPSNLETDSVDSMKQELCYFKPIYPIAQTSFKSGGGLPLKIPGLRVGCGTSAMHAESTPSRAQYIDSLCQLRKLSLADNLPSAFVLAHKVLQVKKNNPVNAEHPGNTNLRIKKKLLACPYNTPALKRRDGIPTSKDNNRINSNIKIECKKTLCRTKSLNSIPKNINETTPKKTKVQERKSISERKPFLRSDTKRISNKKLVRSPSFSPIPHFNNLKMNSVVKNLSSPIKNCDVKVILEEQLRIEKLIVQEKVDLELARKIDAEWNSCRRPRRLAVKRQVTLNHSFRPTKKLKV